VVAGWAEKRFTFGTVTLSMLWVEAIVFPLYAIAPSAVIIGLIAAVEEFVSPIYELMLGNYRMLAIPRSPQRRGPGGMAGLPGDHRQPEQAGEERLAAQGRQ